MTHASAHFVHSAGPLAEEQLLPSLTLDPVMIGSRYRLDHAYIIPDECVKTRLEVIKLCSYC